MNMPDTYGIITTNDEYKRHDKANNDYSLPSTQTLSVLVVPAPAPVPRCSPFIFINKLAEWTNVWSDSNPYFPVPPCEHGGPLEALARGDLQ